MKLGNFQELLYDLAQLFAILIVAILEDPTERLDWTGSSCVR